jgi:hypothetical protein
MMGARSGAPSTKVRGREASGDADSDLKAVDRARAASGELDDDGS